MKISSILADPSGVSPPLIVAYIIVSWILIPYLFEFELYNSATKLGSETVVIWNVKNAEE